MFFKKKKKKDEFFGKNIEPSCFYCRYNSSEDSIACTHGNVVCEKYEYDPLKRTPMGKPVLKVYSKDDFKL